MNWVAWLVVAAIKSYQWLLSPVVGSACRFSPSCSEYARLAVIGYGALRGSWLAVLRILRCQPFHPGGFDPPPPARGRVA